MPRVACYVNGNNIDLGHQAV